MNVIPLLGSFSTRGVTSPKAVPTRPLGRAKSVTSTGGPAPFEYSYSRTV